MPLVDMPLDQLKTYQGRTPCPPALDAYWDNALAEMRALDPEVELQAAEFHVPGVDCFDLFFTGVGGARLHAKYLRPMLKAKAKPHPAVVQFHGYTGSAGDWGDKLSWVAMGYSVASLDCRGQGGSSQDLGGVTGTTFRGHIIRGLQDGPEHLLFQKIYLDTAQLAGILMNMPEVDPARVGALGGSQGGGLTLACAALEPRIARAAPTFPFLCDYRRVWEMDLAKDAYDEVRTFFRQFDPQHEHEEEIWMALGHIDVQHLAKRIRGEVLMGVGLMDTICPPSTQFAAYNKIEAPKRLEIYPDFGHEGLPGFGDKVIQFMLGL
jgi:cephalosporin-C deacetylase